MQKKFNQQFYNSRLFQGVGQDDLDRIACYFQPVEFAAGEVVIEEKSCGDTMYLLLEGDVIVDKVLVSLFEGVEIRPEDKKTTPLSSSQNHYFGELSLFNECQSRSASVIAQSNLLTAAIKKADFEKIIAENPVVGTILLKNIILKLASILDNSNTEIAKLITAFTIALRT